MSHFTEEQLAELATVFGLERADTLPVRDGVVTKDMMVWWRGEKGKRRVSAATDWENIREYPDIYQLDEPEVRSVEYVD
jgi:hypothetical protein